jgi:hypothetical protein
MLEGAQALRTQTRLYRESNQSLAWRSGSHLETSRVRVRRCPRYRNARRRQQSAGPRSGRCWGAARGGDDAGLTAMIRSSVSSMSSPKLATTRSTPAAGLEIRPVRCRDRRAFFGVVFVRVFGTDILRPFAERAPIGYGCRPWHCEDAIIVNGYKTSRHHAAAPSPVPPWADDLKNPVSVVEDTTTRTDVTPAD